MSRGSASSRSTPPRSRWHSRRSPPPPPPAPAILIGGASVNKASIANVIIGTFLYQGLVTMTPTVINSLIHLDISEIIRIIVSNGMIVYALTRKMGGKK